MHVCDRVIDMEIVLDIHGLHKLPGIYIQQEPRKHCCRLDKGSFLASLESTSISHPGKGPPHSRCLLNVHVSIHAFKGLIQVKWLESGFRGAKILGIIHSIVALVLMSIEVRDRPTHLIPK